MTNESIKLCIIGQLEVGKKQYWAVGMYEATPVNDQLALASDGITPVAEVGVLETMAFTFKPIVPSGVDTLRVEDVVWKLTHEKGKNIAEFTEQGSMKVTEYLQRKYQHVFAPALVNN